MLLTPHDMHAIVFQCFSFSLSLQFTHFNSFTVIMFIFTVFLVHLFFLWHQGYFFKMVLESFVKYLSFGRHFSEDLLVKTLNILGMYR